MCIVWLYGFMAWIEDSIGKLIQWPYSTKEYKCFQQTSKCETYHLCKGF